MPAVLARAAVRRILRWSRNWPPRGWVRFGSFRRLKPVSRIFGLDRGQPIDRYYIEAFLASEVSAIQRHILEIGDNAYTMRFGANRVDVSDVLHAEPGNPNATIVGDLAKGEGIADNTFDCIIFTQTLHCIYNVDDVVSVLHRILKPGGVVLATVPGISQISRYDMDRWGDFWRFTTRSAQRLFETHFGTGAVEVRSWGNVLTACCFLQGLSLEELTTAALTYSDPDYQVIITIKATKAKIAEPH
jgi:SAM-dependent methyltransferase